MSADATVVRPVWRGRVHQIALYIAVPAAVLLILAADGAEARAGAIVYSVGLCAMLAVSATYHRWVHTIRARECWRRADHATIYAAIAGTYTAVSLAVVAAPLVVILLALVWGTATAGAVLKISGSHHGETFGSALYLVLGWAGLTALPGLLLRAELWPALWLFLGGVCYTLGAVWFTRGWPRLRPAVFSFHEVWHVCTLLAAAAHFGAIWALST